MSPVGLVPWSSKTVMQFASPLPLLAPRKNVGVQRGDANVTKASRSHAGSVGSGKGGAHERLLRYPNGDTRLIRYPVAESEDVSDKGEAQEVGCEVSDFFVLNEDAQQQVVDVTSKNTTHAPKKQSELPSSPMELIRYLQSDAFKKAQREIERRILSSYKIMEGCPWVVPKALYVLAFQEEGKEAPSTYTLRTRVSRDNTAQELMKLLRGDGGSKDFLSVGEVLDGVIAFSNPDDAERFRDNLEADGYSEVLVCEVQSHELFRNTNETKAVVVLMQCEEYMPFPSELSTSLRGQTSFEDN